MRLSAQELDRLEDDARAMATTACRGFLADASRCVRDTGDAIAALELLRAMWRPPYAGRPNQKAALADAGGWLARRLEREPGIAPERLVLELDWLRRLVVIHASHGGGDPEPDAFRARDSKATFGDHIEQLRKRRARATRATAHEDLFAPRPAPEPRAPLAPDGPSELPESIAAQLATWAKAVQTFRDARERIRRGKLPKARMLEVEAVEPALRRLTGDIVCSSLETEGMDELQERVTANGGKPLAFWIRGEDLEPRDGKRVLRRIWLHAP